MDFPTWFAAGTYGGLVCALLAAASVALLALQRRRGTRRQIAFAFLTALIACALMLAPVWWLARWLDVYGPAVGGQEVTFWLIWISLFGWAVPLLTAASFFLFASPELARASATPDRVSETPTAATPLDDPARRSYPYGSDRPWGRLTPMGSDAPAIDLLLEVTLIGRDPADDVIIDDDLVSRSHAELRWRAGKAWLLDRGSLNGTRRNAHVSRGLVQLDESDTLQFGAQRYRVTIVAPPATAELEETRKVASAHASLPPSVLLTLVAEIGSSPGRRWELREKTTTIGRDPTASVTLDDSSVSRFHAQITRQASGYYLADLESSNGVLVNGAQVTEPHLIVAGDLLCFGEVCVRCDGASSPVAPADERAQELSAAVGDTPGA